MPAGNPLTPRDYRYDGSWDGLLCCLFETYERKELPQAIYSHEETQQSLYPALEILTDPNRVQRVKRSMKPKIGAAAAELAEHAFLTCLPQRELWILRFLRLAFRCGPPVMNQLTNPAVHTLNKAVLHLHQEAHQYQGFVRFSVSDGALWSVIEPKNQVLPLLAPHFCARFCNEAFLIYDKTHDTALVYQNGRHELLPLLAFEPPEPDETEQRYRRLWQTFYDSIAIRDRENLRLRMTHMQKRYWKHLTEMQARPLRIPTEQGVTPQNGKATAAETSQGNRAAELIPTENPNRASLPGAPRTPLP